MSRLIRRAQVEDAAAIARVRVETWRAAYRGIVPDATLHALDAERTRANWERTLADQEATGLALYVVEDPEAGVAGYVGVGPERGQIAGARGEVFMLYVHPAAQGRGYGRDLLMKGLDDLDRHGLFPAVVWVLHDNPARAFYERMGARYVTNQVIELGAPLVEDAYRWDDRGMAR